VSFWSERVLPPVIEAVCSGAGPTKHRSEVVPLAEGRTLDLGIGSGLNLGFADAARIESWVGIDPSPALLARARERATQARFPVELVEGRGERLPFDQASFDSVVVTYTFCSVEDPGATAAEIARVLKPGGKVLFAEHGVAERPFARGVQHRLDPGWRRVAGGCSLDRDFVGTMLDTRRFVVESLRLRETFPKWMSTVRSGVLRGAVTRS
jgi:ubiquinone/menaquinone biosynthesis C-methylase UbiE